MRKTYVFLTQFIVEKGNESNAYNRYRERVQNLLALGGVDVISVSKNLQQAEKAYGWESLSDQYQMEHDGKYPENHILCDVYTVVVLNDIEKFEEAAELLIMDDRDVSVDAFPSRVDAFEQVLF